jgi:hypothetical protein
MEEEEVRRILLHSSNNTQRFGSIVDGWSMNSIAFLLWRVVFVS